MAAVKNRRPRGVIQINQNCSIEISSAHPNRFELLTDNNVKIFAQTETEKEAQVWVQHIAAVINACKAELKRQTDALVAKEKRAMGTAKAAGGPPAKNHSKDGLHTFVAQGTQFIVNDKYELIKPIGHGAYGVVVAARNTVNHTKVAIKKVPGAFEDLLDAKRILREIRLLQHFQHDNIICIKNLVHPPSNEKFNDVYIVTDLMETDLHRVIYSRQILSDEHIKFFVYQLLCALKYLHSAGVIHRDLKPSNLLLNSDCDLKICDFGLARGIETDQTTLTEYVVTRWYRAPEIMLACSKYTNAIDMWACGCIMAELFGRKPLFPGTDYINQLQIIVGIVGTPEERDLGFITSGKALNFIRGLDASPNVPYSKMYPKGNPDGLKLLECMLQFNPARRISVDKALAHPYLASVANPEDERECPAQFRFAEEDTKDLTCEGIRQAILREIKKYRAKDRAAAASASAMNMS